MKYFFLIFVLLISGCSWWEGETKQVQTIQQAYATPEGVQTNCNQEFESLQSAYGKSFAGCFFNFPQSTGCDLAGAEKSNINIIIIFDDSGSMSAHTQEWQTLIDLAKSQLKQYIATLDESVRISFIIYGHKGSSSFEDKQLSCSGVEEIFPLEQTDRSNLLSYIDGLQPNGWTPIENALEKAKNIISTSTQTNDNNIILLVSDGEEACDGNPTNKAQEIANTLPNTTIDVIGLQVIWKAQEQLVRIAKNGKGKYHDVRNIQDFQFAFDQTKNVLNAMNCSAGKMAIELSTAMNALNAAYMCQSEMLEERIHLISNASVSCKDTFQNTFQEQDSVFLPQIEEIRRNALYIIHEWFDSQIQTIEEKIRSMQWTPSPQIPENNIPTELPDMEYPNN